MLERLTGDEAYAARWRRYYTLVVQHPLRSEKLKRLMEILSKVYHPYNSKFDRVIRQYVYPWPEMTCCLELLGSSCRLTLNSPLCIQRRNG